jgi:hypothetical protein
MALPEANEQASLPFGLGEFRFAWDFRTAQRVGGRLLSGSGCRGFSSGRARVYTFFLCGLHGKETNAKKHSIGLILLGILNFWLRKRARGVRERNCTHWREFFNHGWTRTGTDWDRCYSLSDACPARVCTHFFCAGCTARKRT